MKLVHALPFVSGTVLATLLGLGACSSDDVGSSSSDLTSCEGAYKDAGGRCRLQNGQFAHAACCAVDETKVADACEAYCALRQTCNYGAPADCVADCVGRGAECTLAKAEPFASCVETYTECDDGEDLFQCVDESECLAPADPPPPDERLPYQPACDAYCGQMKACDASFGDDFWCASGCLSSCSLTELQALEACNANNSPGCAGQTAYVDCLRAGVACIAPEVPPVHEGEGPWGEACVAYCDIVWKCDYGYSTTCMDECQANQSSCGTEDLAALVECTQWYNVCDDGEDFGQCVDGIGCFAKP